MARRALPSYDALTLPAAQPANRPEPERAGEGSATLPRRSKRKVDETMKGRARAMMTYVDEGFHLALKRYTIEQGADAKMHDFQIEAFQEWCDKRGLNVTVRVPSRDREIGE